MNTTLTLGPFYLSSLQRKFSSAAKWLNCQLGGTDVELACVVHKEDLCKLFLPFTQNPSEDRISLIVL